MYPYPPHQNHDEPTMADVRGVLPNQRPPVDITVLDEPTSEVPVVRPGSAPETKTRATETPRTSDADQKAGQADQPGTAAGDDAAPPEAAAPPDDTAPPEAAAPPDDAGSPDDGSPGDSDAAAAADDVERAAADDAEPIATDRDHTASAEQGAGGGAATPGAIGSGMARAAWPPAAAPGGPGGFAAPARFESPSGFGKPAGFGTPSGGPAAAGSPAGPPVTGTPAGSAAVVPGRAAGDATLTDRPAAEPATTEQPDHAPPEAQAEAQTEAARAAATRAEADHVTADPEEAVTDEPATEVAAADSDLAATDATATHPGSDPATDAGPGPTDPEDAATVQTATDTATNEQPTNEQPTNEQPIDQQPTTAVAGDRPAQSASGAPATAEVATVSPEPTGADAAEAVDHAPGEVSESPIGLWTDEAVELLRESWRELQVRFIDDPQAAVEGARELVTEAVRDLADTLLATQDEWDPYRDGERVDTETLRVAMRRYREFLDRVLAL